MQAAAFNLDPKRFSPNRMVYYGPEDTGPMPYVTFEDRAVEDREATVRDGMPRYKNVIFVKVMSAGSKDTYENVAEDWLSYLEMKASMGMYSPEWAQEFRRAYNQYQEQGHADIAGTPIRMVSFLNAGEIESCLAANVFTVEGLASVGEDGLNLIGMGARSLQQRAQAYLAQQSDSKIATQVASVINQLDSLKEAMDAKDELIAELQREIQASRRRRSKRDSVDSEEIEDVNIV